MSRVTQFAFRTKTVAVNYIANSDRRLLAQTPVPSRQLAKTFRVNAGPCKKRGPAFLFVLSFIGTALEVTRFVSMSERATTQVFGWALSSVLLVMLILNAIAG